MKLPTWFRLDLEVPFLRVFTNVMQRCACRDVFVYYEFHIMLWKWHFEFEIGERNKHGN